MNDAEYAAQRSRLSRIVEDWHQTLGLKWWRGAYEYDRDGEDFRDEEGGGKGWQTLAHCQASWQYQRFRIVFNMLGFRDVPDAGDVEEHVVHEMVHALVDELAAGDKREDASEHLEHVTQALTKAFLWVRDTARPPAEPGVY